MAELNSGLIVSKLHTPSVNIPLVDPLKNRSDWYEYCINQMNEMFPGLSLVFPAK